MNQETKRESRNRRILRAGGWLLAGATILKVWWAPAPWETPAVAQIPDSGLQRKLLIDEARRTNDLLSDIRRILEKSTINVRIQGADNPDDAAPPARGGKSAGDR